MAHEHNIRDSDLHFVIDPATREIENQSGKSVIVQYDHKSECLTFELPRRVENHDMLECDKVEVLCINKDTKNKTEAFKAYKVLDLRLDPEDENKVIFSCTITDEVTQYAGNLDFSVRFKCLTDFVWNTLILSEIKVEKGMPKTDDVAATPEEDLAEIERLVDESGVVEYDNTFKD